MSVTTGRQAPCLIEVHVVFWQEGDEFFGHCLQFDIVAVGDTPEEVGAQMMRLIEAHVKYTSENDNWEYLYRPAPQEVWQRFAEAEASRRGPQWMPQPQPMGARVHADKTRVDTRFAFAA